MMFCGCPLLDQLRRDEDESIILSKKEIQWENLLSVRNVGHTGSEAGLALHNGESIDTFGQRGGPTIVAKDMVQCNGRYYYEVELCTSEFFQLGWATPSFIAKPDEGKGCGDDKEGMSWGYNGGNGLQGLRHGRVEQRVEINDNISWKAGDVIGLGIDIDQGIIFIFVNNTQVFKSTPYERKFFKDGVYPAVSLSRGSHCQIRFGSWDTPFLGNLPKEFKCWPIPEKYYSVNEKHSSSNMARSNVPIVPMNDGSNSYSTNDVGSLMVHMMGRGIEYEAKKNALVGVGLKWAHKILDARMEKANSIPTHDDSSAESIILNKVKKDQLLAIIIYTLGHAPYPPVYRFFNSDTRKGMSASGNDFPILFQLLEDGIRSILEIYLQISKQPGIESNDKDGHECKNESENNTQEYLFPFTTYRGMGIRFKANIGDKVRFGQFTSTSANPKIAKDFIEQEGAGGSLLTIKSNLGAPIWELSEFPNEMEVLIPPCEPFKVVKYEEEGRHIVLESLVPLDMVEEYVKGKESASTIALL